MHPRYIRNQLAANAGPSNLSAKDLHDDGMDLERSNELEKAIECFAKAYHLEPNNRTYAQSYAICFTKHALSLRAQNNYENLIAVFHKIFSIEFCPPEVMREIINILLDDAQYNQANDFLNIAINRYPESAIIQHCYANYYTHIEDYNNALIYYNSAFKLAYKEKEKNTILLDEAKCYLLLKQYDEAYQCLEQAQEILPNDLFTFLALIRFHFDKHDYEAAHQNLLKANQYHANENYLKLAWTFYFYAVDKNKKLNKLSNELLNVEPPYAGAHTTICFRSLIKELNDRKNLKDKKPITETHTFIQIERSLQKLPDNIHLLLFKAKLYSSSNDFYAAEKLLSFAKQKNPFHLQTYVDLIYLYIKFNKSELKGRLSAECKEKFGYNPKLIKILKDLNELPEDYDTTYSYTEDYSHPQFRNIVDIPIYRIVFPENIQKVYENFSEFPDSILYLHGQTLLYEINRQYALGLNIAYSEEVHFYCLTDDPRSLTSLGYTADEQNPNYYKHPTEKIYITVLDPQAFGATIFAKNLTIDGLVCARDGVVCDSRYEDENGICFSLVDLQSKKLVAVTNPAQLFADHPIELLRIMEFILAGFTPDDKLKTAMQKYQKNEKFDEQKEELYSLALNQLKKTMGNIYVKKLGEYGLLKLFGIHHSLDPIRANHALNLRLLDPTVPCPIAMPDSPIAKKQKKKLVQREKNPLLDLPNFLQPSASNPTNTQAFDKLPENLNKALEELTDRVNEDNFKSYPTTLEAIASFENKLAYTLTKSIPKKFDDSQNQTTTNLKDFITQLVECYENEELKSILSNCKNQILKLREKIYKKYSNKPLSSETLTTFPELEIYHFVQGLQKSSYVSLKIDYEHPKRPSLQGHLYAIRHVCLDAFERRPLNPIPLVFAIECTIIAIKANLVNQDLYIYDGLKFLLNRVEFLHETIPSAYKNLCKQMAGFDLYIEMYKKIQSLRTDCKSLYERGFTIRADESIVRPSLSKSADS